MKNTVADKTSLMRFRKRVVLLVCIILCVTLFVLYRQVLSHDFLVIDDTVYVTDNPHVKGGLSLSNIKWAFTTFKAEFWHPMTWISLMLDASLYGTNPGGFHLTNFLLHDLNTILLFIILNTMTSASWPSAFIAALFALHPIHVEPVAWISSRKDDLGAFFAFLTIWAYLKYAKQKNAQFYVLSVISFAASLMSKSIFMTLPFILLLIDFWPLNRLKCSNADMLPKISYRRAFAEKIPFLLLSLAIGILTLLAQQSSGGLIPLSDYPFPNRIANAIATYSAYIVKMFWPLNLSCIYPLKTDVSILSTTLSSILVGGTLAIAIYFRRNHGYLIVGGLWFLLALAPVSGLIKVGDFSIADRYAYFPIVGVYLMMTWTASELVEKWKISKTLCALFAIALLFLLSMLSFKQIGFWKDSITLFEHAMQVTEGNYMAQSALGHSLAQQGNFENAVAHFQEAARLKPERINYQNDLGKALVVTGHFAEAVSVLESVIERKARYPELFYYLGLARTGLKCWDRAIESFYQALLLKHFRMDDSNAEMGAAFSSTAKTEKYLNNNIKQDLDTDCISFNKTALVMDDPKGRYCLAISFVREQKTTEALALFHIKDSSDWLKMAAFKGFSRWPLLHQ